MALTRKMLTAMGLTEEQVESIIEAHTETANAVSRYRADAEKLADVQRELDELKNAGSGYKKRYEDEHAAFEAYKADTEAKATAAEKAKLYRAALKAAGVDEKRFDAVMRLVDLSKVSVKDGKLTDEQAVIEDIKRDWGDYIPTIQTHGTRVDNPPRNQGAGMTRDQIAAIRDPIEMQRAIADNMDSLKGEIHFGRK